MNKSAMLLVAAALAVGLGGGYWIAYQQGSRQAAAPEAGSGERTPLYYRNPMNPTITSPVPAQDEMGMDYIPVYADKDGGGDEPAGTVKIDPVTVQNIGVRTARAEKGVLSRTVRAVGRVDFDETRLTRLHPKIEGWIEEMWVEKTGEQVARDAIMLSIYSPQMVSGQEEYLLALNNRDTLAKSPFEDIRHGAEALVKSARQRLALLDMPGHQIRELEQSGEIKRSVHIHSPFSGVVTKVGVRKGQFVSPKTELYQVADLSKVWVYANVFEYELPWIKEGDKARMNLVALPGRTFRGHISYIYPYLEAKTRTVKVRLEFDNPDGALKPEMFADVILQAGRKEEAVLVPAEAVVRSGTREQVFVVRGPGKFEPREVVIGVTSEGKTQILKGVDAGEEVVTSAQFLIDSESKLREATAKMLEAMAAPAQEGMDMSDMDMDMDDAHDSMDGGGRVMSGTITEGSASVEGGDVQGSTNAAGAGSAGAATTPGATMGDMDMEQETKP